MKFSIGYNHDPKLLDLLDDYKENIEALYFPIPNQYLGTGRGFKQKKSYPKEIPIIIKKCNSLKIKSQLLLNETCEGKPSLKKEFFAKLINYIRRLKKLGLKSIVITNPVYIQKIREAFKDILIESSINCYVRTVEQALYLKQFGIDVLTIDRTINRNIPLINEIKKQTKLKIRMLLNEGCIRYCPFRHLHYNLISHRAQRSQQTIKGLYPERLCISVFQKSPADVFRVPFIPPEKLKKYSKIVDYNKLSTRSFSTERIKLCLDAYINQSFSGDLLDILDSPCLTYFNSIDYDLLKKSNFFDKTSKCDLNCKKCNFYCQKLLKKAAVINSSFC
ncbi:MAG: U32 family peptidase [Candidatus Margulisbacteria bacterium]|nr:U32 family peptidase [Candidatus Margulisiibacteriota bacterium]MBU1021091.1 U32 family peptidase [Candidatus Margulisiibacteriota bacterium]MBU1729900.1 U32 family peptidase [Candidatus Margulisiibacteriota bacterium]MBU1955230.1 U32 family peptidase [Candidatus Margulisiibacteriota bacterium]